MRDGIGSVVMITIIIVFIVCASSYLAYNVNYTKAFRMKNKIISIYEDYNGVCTQACEQEIFDYSRDLGYQPASIDCNEYDAKPTDNPLYCVQKVIVNTEAAHPGNPGMVIGDKIGTHYYKIVTKININIPIFDNIFGMRFLYINGDTKLF